MSFPDMKMRLLSGMAFLATCADGTMPYLAQSSAAWATFSFVNEMDFS